jgi:hypothetical protein
MGLLWFANCCALQGFTDVHFTCEVSKEICNDRVDAMNSDIRARELVVRAGEARDALMSKGVKGKLIMYEYPTKSLTVEEIERQIVRLQVELGTHVDMITVDYMDILKPSRRYKDDRWAEQAAVAEDYLSENLQNLISHAMLIKTSGLQHGDFICSQSLYYPMKQTRPMKNI